MAVKLIETKLINEAGFASKLGGAASDFTKGFFQGAKSEILSKLGIEDFETWLKHRKLSKTELMGLKSGVFYKGRIASKEILLYINRNDNKLIYFEWNDLTVPLELIGLLYPDWSERDTSILSKVGKKLGCEILTDFNNWTYQQLKNFLYQYHLNIFSDEWTDEEKRLWNDTIDSKNFKNVAFNTLILDTVSNCLENSKITDKELLGILGRKPRGADRKSVCHEILENLIRGAKKSQQVNYKFVSYKTRQRNQAQQAQTGSQQQTQNQTQPEFVDLSKISPEELRNNINSGKWSFKK